MHPKYDPSNRTIRSRVFYSIAVVFAAATIIYLIFSLSTLILPVLLGILFAYICQPLLSLMYRNGISRAMSTLILFAGFLLILFLLARYVLGLVPGEFEQLELRASIMQNVNDRYQTYMGLDENLQNGNMIHEFVGPEFDPLMDTFNEWLYLSEPNQVKLQEWARLQDEETAGRIEDLVSRMSAMRLYTNPDIRLAEDISISDQEQDENTRNDEESFLLGVLNILSLWLIMPVMFLFFLVDNGQMRRGLITIVPNNYFEMVLTVMENVDRAIGNYLRGTLIEILLMTLTIWTLLVLIGFDLGFGFVLALVSGIANAIPIFGMFIGIGICAIYALILVDVSAPIPWVTVENLILWVIGVHLLAQAVDNAVFKPFVLGKAVSLHPIVVFLGAIVGSILFGFVGLLFAIPAIVILKETIGTFHRQLKAYFLIY